MTHKIFADTSFLIALLRTEDQMHKRAKEIFDPTNKFFVSTIIFNEFITFLARKNNNETAYIDGTKILDSDIVIIQISNDELRSILEIMKKYNKMSFCDASSVKIMKELGINKIYSFDSDFDLIPGIERIH